MHKKQQAAIGKSLSGMLGAILFLPPSWGFNLAFQAVQKQ